MKILPDISAVEVRFKKTLDDERKIEVMQSCTGDDYAQDEVHGIHRNWDPKNKPTKW